MTDGYVLLGSDGLDYIAAVQMTPEQARRVTDGMRPVSRDEWNRFVAGEGI